MILRPKDPIGAHLGLLYKERPDLFDEQQVSLLRTVYPTEFQPPPPTEDEVTIGKISEQFASGMVAGFTGLGDFADDPTNTWEGLANQTGSLLGFLGILIPLVGESGLIARIGSTGLRGALVGAKAVGALGKGAEAERLLSGGLRAATSIGSIRSLPLLAGDIGFSALERSSAGKLAAELLRGRPIMQQAVESGLKLGIASGAGELHEIWDEGLQAPIHAFAFGALTGGVMDAGIGNIPFLRQQTIPHNLIKAFAGATTQAMTPMIAGQDPTADIPSLAYNAALGAFFGYKAVDATTYKAGKFIHEMTSKPEYQNFQGMLRAGSIESTKEFDELSKSDKKTADRVQELAGDIFGRPKEVGALLNHVLRLAFPDLMPGTYAYEKIDANVGDMLHIDGTPVNERWVVREVHDNEFLIENPVTKEQRLEPPDKLNKLPVERRDSLVAPSETTLDFESNFQNVQKTFGRFFTQVIHNPETGERYNPIYSEERILGHMLNMQERVREYIESAPTTGSNAWDNFKEFVKRNVEPALRTVTDGEGKKKIVPYTEEDFAPLKEWFSFEASKVPVNKRMWDPFKHRLVDYQESADGRFLKDVKGNLTDRYRSPYAFESLRDGNVNEDGTPSYFKAMEITDMSRSHKGRDGEYFSMESLLDADMSEKEYGRIIREAMKNGYLFHSGEGDKHALLFTTKANDAQLAEVRKELDSISNDAIRADLKRMAEETGKRLGLTETEWETLFYNNLYLWKGMNKHLSLETLLTMRRDDGKYAFITNPLDYNKRVQIQVQKYTQLNNSIYKSPIEGAMPRIVITQDLENVVPFLKGSDTATPQQLDEMKAWVKTLNDGGWIVPAPVFDSMAEAIGLPKSLGAMKAFYRDSTPESGMMLHKFAIHRATDKLSAALMERGGLILAPVSAAKQVGLRKMYHYHFDDEGKLVFTRTVKRDGKTEIVPDEQNRILPDSYEFNPEGLYLSTGTKDMAAEHMNERVKLAKQMLNDHTDPKAFRDLVDYILTESKGDVEGNGALDSYLQNRTSESLSIAAQNFDRMDRMRLLKQLNVDPELERAFNEYALRNDNEESFKEALESGEFDTARVDHAVQKYINAGAGKDGVLMSKLASSSFRKAYTRFFVKDILEPKLKNSGNAVIGAWGLEMMHMPQFKHVWQTNDYFALGREWRKLNIKGIDGEDTTLGKVWDAFAKFGFKEDGSIKTAKDFKGEERVLYEKYRDVLTAIVPRVPLDSPSGAPALMFGGFAPVDGGQIFVSSKLASRMGGADHDIDKAFFYFGLPKSVKEFYRRSAADYDTLFKGVDKLMKDMDGKPDKYIADAQRSVAATFDPMARLLINKNVAVGRGQALPFAISASEKIAVMKQGVESVVARVAPIKSGLKVKVNVNVKPGLTRVTYDPSTDTYVYHHGNKLTTQTQLSFRGDNSLGSQTKTAAINKAADAGKSEYGIAHPGKISSMIYASRIDGIKIRGMFGGEHNDPIELLRPGEDINTLPLARQAAIQMYFGAPHELVYRNDNGIFPLKNARFGMRRKDGRPYFFYISRDLGTREVVDLRKKHDNIGLRVNGEFIALDPAYIQQLAIATHTKLRYTDFGMYEDAMQKVYRKDRAENESWSLNDVNESLQRVVENPFFNNSPLSVLGKHVQGLYYDDNLITHVVPSQKYTTMDERFKPYVAFMKANPLIRQLIGEDIGLPTKQLFQRADAFSSVIPFTASEAEIRRVAMAYDQEAGDNALRVHAIHYARLTDRLKNATDVEILEDFRKRGEDLMTVSGRIRYMKHERDRINDMLSERIYTMASVTRMMDTVTDMNLSPQTQAIIGEALAPIVENAKLTKKAYFEFTKLRDEYGKPNSSIDIERVVKAEDDLETLKDNVFAMGDFVAGKYGIAPEAMRAFTESVLIGSLRYRSDDGRIRTGTSETSIGMRWASNESIRKFAEAYSESYRSLVQPGVPAEAVRKLWGSRVQQKVETTEVPGETMLLFMKTAIPRAEVPMREEHKPIADALIAAIQANPGLKNNPADFVRMVRKQYNVSNIGELTIPQTRGLVSFLNEMRSGSTLMNMLWAKFRNPELYKDLRTRDWMKFIWTIDKEKQAEMFAPIHEKLFNADGRLMTGMIPPLPHITDEGKLRMVYAESAIPMSFVGRIANDFNLANLRTQRANEEHNRLINDTFGSLLFPIVESESGKDYGKTLYSIAVLNREIDGMYRDRELHPLEFTDNQKELLAYKQAERQKILSENPSLFDRQGMVEKDVTEFTIPKFKLVVPMNNIFGVGDALKAAPDVHDISAFDAVVSGKKTGRTSITEKFTGVDVGDVIKMSDVRKREVFVRVTGKRLVGDTTPEEYARTEGYDVDEVRAKWDTLKTRHQITFEPMRLEMKTVKRKVKDNIPGMRFKMRGEASALSARDVVNRYSEALRVMFDDYAVKMLHGTPEQWTSYVRRDKDGRFLLNETASSWSELFGAGQVEFNIPYDIIASVRWYAGLTREAWANKTQPFTFDDIANFRLDHMKHLKAGAEKFGLINGKNLDDAYQFMMDYRKADLAEQFPEQHEWALQFLRYFGRVRYNDGTYANKLLGQKQHSQYAADVEFTENNTNGYNHRLQTLIWQRPGRLTGRVDGFFPHIEWDAQKTEQWALNRIDEEIRRAPNDVAGARARAEAVSNLYHKVRGEAFMEDGGMNDNLAEELVTKKPLGGGSSSSMHSRDAFLPTYNYDASVMQTYFNKLASARMKLFAGMQAENAIGKFNERFVPMVKEGKVSERYRSGWEDYMRLFARDAMNYPSIFPKEMLDSPHLNLRRTPYYWLSDHAWVNPNSFARKIWNTLFRTAKLTPVEVKNIEVKLGRPLLPSDTEEWEKRKFAMMNDFGDPNSKEWSPQAMQNFRRASTYLRRFSEWEGRWETATLLFHPKTAVGNVYGGALNNIVWNGMRHFRSAQSIDTWKGIAVKSRDGVSFESMDDVYRWWESTGAVANQMVMEGSWAQDFKTPQQKSFLEEVIGRMKKDSRMTDETLYEVASRHGLDKTFVDRSGYFMKKSERFLRIHAGLAGYLQAREQFSPMDLPLSTPYLIDMGIKSTQLTQFMYDAPNRPAFSRTNLGRVFSRFKVWAWASNRFQRDIMAQARYNGYSMGSVEMDRLQRVMTANLFALGLGTMIPYSIFDYALPAPLSYWQDAAKFFFGDDKAKEDMYFGSRSVFLKYPLNPLNELMPPISRLPQAGVEMFNMAFKADETDWLSQYTFWSVFPYGRMGRDVLRAMKDPEMAFDFMTGLPMHKIGYNVKKD